MVRVVNPDPVKRARVALELERNGSPVDELSGATNRAGEVVFRLQRANAGSYTATVTSLSHSDSTWDEIRASATYELSR